MCRRTDTTDGVTDMALEEISVTWRRHIPEIRYFMIGGVEVDTIPAPKVSRASSASALRKRTQLLTWEI